MDAFTLLSISAAIELIIFTQSNLSARLSAEKYIKSFQVCNNSMISEMNAID